MQGIENSYIQTGKVKSVSKQMKKNPKIEISGMNGGKWIRVTGETVLDERIEAQKHMLDNYPSLQKLYQLDDGNTEVFYLKHETAQICSFTEEPKTFKF